MSPAVYTIDRLERRQLFAVTLDDGVVNVIGTARRDVVYVYPDPKDNSKLDVKLNHRVWQFERSDVASVFIRTHRGDDVVMLPSRELDVPSRIYSDAGTDIVRAAGGATRVFGGDATDIIESVFSRQRATLYGEGGDDQLEGGSANDLLEGGAGDDILKGGAGSDIIGGGAGNDLLLGGDGIDSLFGNDGEDDLDGGVGDDLLLGGAGHDDRLLSDPRQAMSDSTDDLLGGNANLSGERIEQEYYEDLPKPK